MLSINSPEPGILVQKSGKPYTDVTLTMRIGTDIDHLRIALKLFRQLGMMEMAKDVTML